MSVQLSAEQLLAALGVMAIAGVLIGWVIYTSQKTIKKLRNTDYQEELRERRQKEKEWEEEREVTQALLNRYREMYALERDSKAREIAELKEQVDELSRKVAEWEARYDELAAENQRVLALNLQLQEDARRGLR